MRRFAPVQPRAGLRKSVVPIVALCFSFSLLAQKSDTSQPKYDVQTEAKMKGSIDDVKVPPKSASKEVVHLTVKSGADMLDIYLCPQSFLDDMGMTLNKGDDVVVTGSKIKQGEADLVLAREVAKGTDTLVLRDGKGIPVWSWHR